MDNGGVGALGNNGRIDNPSGRDFLEPNALWEQLAKAGFIEGHYSGASTTPTTVSNQTPLNAFNNVVVLGRTLDNQDSVVPSIRLNLVLGRGVPVDIARETDIKLDDGNPLTGALRLSINDPGNVFGEIGSSDPRCLDSANNNYNIAGDV